MSVSPIDITKMLKYVKCILSKLDKAKITVITDVGFEVRTVVVMKIELFGDYL
jgi:hypothetical protein